MTWYAPVAAPPRLQRAVVRPIPRTVVRWAVVVVIAGAIAMKLVIPPWMKGFGMSKVDIGREIVKDYGQAIPEWRAEHPGRPCPAAVSELTKYTRNQDIRDPWGDALGMVCTPEGIVVYSLGEDGRLGTRDDLWSAR